MSNLRLIVGLTALALLSSCDSEREYVHAGLFKFQANTPSRTSIYEVADLAIKSHGYLPLQKRMQEPEGEASGSVLYGKEEKKYLLMFTPTEGVDCYQVSINTFDDKRAIVGKEELDKIKKIVAKELEKVNGSIFDIENCEDYS